MEYLDLLTEFAIANELNLCHILLTIFNETGSPQVLSNKERLEQYFENLYLQSDYFEFVKRVGLDTSKMEFQKTGGEGYFSFDLTNMEGIQYGFQLNNETDKRKFCKLSISVFTPKGMKNCFDVSLSSEQFLLYHHHKDYHVSSKEEMKLYAEQRVADLKSRGYENAGIYDPEGVGGTHVMYVLHHADKPELYSGLPKDPQIDLTVTVWKDILKPVAAVAMGGLALAEIGHYLAVGPNVEEDVEDHHEKFEEEDRKGGKDE